MIVDTHCHLNESCFESDVDEIVLNFEKDNIQSAFVVGTEKSGILKALELAKKHDRLFAIVGLYPEYCEQYDDDFELFLERQLSNPKVVAVGEIGLDFHTDGFDQKKQEEVFARQIRLAHKFGLPISVHTREAFDRTLAVLKENKEFLNGGVIHCFSGSPEIAKEFLKLGFKLGFGGVCTFKNAKKVVDTLREIDTRDILLETDAPYLAPTPHRGERNEPKFTNLVLEKIAEIRGEDKKVLERQIFENTMQVFKRFGN